VSAWLRFEIERLGLQGRVRHHSPTSEVGWWYGGADLLVLPTRYANWTMSRTRNRRPLPKRISSRPAPTSSSDDRSPSEAGLALSISWPEHRPGDYSRRTRGGLGPAPLLSDLFQIAHGLIGPVGQPGISHARRFLSPPASAPVAFASRRHKGDERVHADEVQRLSPVFLQVRPIEDARGIQ
jgi:hypothetical protein